MLPFRFASWAASQLCCEQANKQTHRHKWSVICTQRSLMVMDRLFILGHICIHKGLSAHICVFTRCVLWPNENKSIVPLGISRPSDVHPQQSINTLTHAPCVSARKRTRTVDAASGPTSPLALNPNLYSKHLGTSETRPLRWVDVNHRPVVRQRSEMRGKETIW